MSFDFVNEQKNKANPEETLSEFEIFMTGEIAEWRSMQDRVFDTWKETVKEFWKEKGIF